MLHTSFQANKIFPSRFALILCAILPIVFTITSEAIRVDTKRTGLRVSDLKSDYLIPSADEYYPIKNGGGILLKSPQYSNRHLRWSNSGRLLKPENGCFGLWKEGEYLTHVLTVQRVDGKGDLQHGDSIHLTYQHVYVRSGPFNEMGISGKSGAAELKVEREKGKGTVMTGDRIYLKLENGMYLGAGDPHKCASFSTNKNALIIEAPSNDLGEWARNNYKYYDYIHGTTDERYKNLAFASKEWGWFWCHGVAYYGHGENWEKKLSSDYTKKIQCRHKKGSIGFFDKDPAPGKTKYCLCATGQKVIGDSPDKYDLNYVLEYKDQGALPATYNYRVSKKHCVGPFKDQGACGSCVQFAISSCIQYRRCLGSKLLSPLDGMCQSYEADADKKKSGDICDGADTLTDFALIATKTGLVEQKFFDYPIFYTNFWNGYFAKKEEDGSTTGNQIPSAICNKDDIWNNVDHKDAVKYTLRAGKEYPKGQSLNRVEWDPKKPKGIEATKREVLKYGPVVMGGDGHAMLIVGWGSDYFLAENSHDYFGQQKDSTWGTPDGTGLIKVPFARKYESVVFQGKPPYKSDLNEVLWRPSAKPNKMDIKFDCFFEDVVNGLKCGWDSVTDGVECGWNTFTTTITSGVECGWNTVTKTVTDGVVCGWNWFTSLFTGKKAKSCKIAKKVAKSCEKLTKSPKTCKVPKSCKSKTCGPERKSPDGTTKKVEKGTSCSSASDCEKTDICKDKRCEVTWLLKLRDGICADAYHRNTHGGTVKTYACNHANLNQQWEYDPLFQRIKNKNGICLSAADNRKEWSHVVTQNCDETKIEQRWIYSPFTGLLKNLRFGKCLDANNRHANGGQITAWNCNKDNKNQQWWVTRLA